jgi:hypothetical protein
MLTKQILDHTGNIMSEFIVDEVDSRNLQIHHKVTQDIEPTLRLTKNLRDNQHLDPFANKQSGWKRVAEIPRVLYDQLAQQGITRDKKKFRAWLNDYANKPFRVWEGRL